jgi:hypothetical protein
LAKTGVNAGPEPGDHPEDLGPLGVLDGALACASRYRLELHTVYG